MTKHDTETSVVLAFAELARLERERASFASAKRELHGRLETQRCTLSDIRERLVAERPRAWSRVRREQLRARRMRDRVAAEARASAEAEHIERLGRFRAELEAKRARLAHLESLPEVPRPGRKLVEWSMPAAAAALVAMLGVAAFSEPAAEAHAPDTIVELEPELLAFPGEDLSVPFAAEQPAPPTPEAVTPSETKTKAKSSKSKSSKSKSSKSKSSKSKTAKSKSDMSKSDTGISKRDNPLILTNDNGNPLG